MNSFSKNELSNTLIRTVIKPRARYQNTQRVVMSSVVQVISKEGKNVEFSVEVANTSKYLQTVLKEDPEATEIQTTIPYNALVIAKQFCKDVLWS